MMTLVDTSVWVNHLRHGNERLVEMLEKGSVCCHQFVIGELACGTLRNRNELLSLMSALPATPMADHDEVLHLIVRRNLAGRGLGWMDLHLLASALIADCALWTFDKSLSAVAAQLKLVSTSTG